METYREFYGLRGRPFALTPDPDFFFGAKSHRRALDTLSNALARSEAGVVITGPAGVGKTTLIRLLQANLGTKCALALGLPAVTTKSETVFEALANALGISLDPDTSPAESVERALRAHVAADGGVVIALDEAQRLAPRAFDAIRPLLDLQGPGGPLIRLLLVGRPELDAHLSRSELAWLRERLVANHRLAPLEPDEIAPYVEHRLTRVGWQDDPRLSPDLFAVLRHATGGLPRRINQVMSRLLVLAALDRRHEIGAADVDEAVEGLDAASGCGPVGHFFGELGPEGPDTRPHEAADLARRLATVEGQLAQELERRVQFEAEIGWLRTALRTSGPGPAAKSSDGNSPVDTIVARQSGCELDRD